jgi:hypothetical protein
LKRSISGYSEWKNIFLTKTITDSRSRIVFQINFVAHLQLKSTLYLYLRPARPPALQLNPTKHSYPWAPRPVPLQLNSTQHSYLRPARPPALQSRPDNYAIRTNPPRSYLEGRRPRRLAITLKDRGETPVMLRSAKMVVFPSRLKVEESPTAIEIKDSGYYYVFRTTRLSARPS